MKKRLFELYFKILYAKYYIVHLTYFSTAIILCQCTIFDPSSTKPKLSRSLFYALGMSQDQKLPAFSYEWRSVDVLSRDYLLMLTIDW